MTHSGVVKIVIQEVRNRPIFTVDFSQKNYPKHMLLLIYIMILCFRGLHDTKLF